MQLPEHKMRQFSIASHAKQQARGAGLAGNSAGPRLRHNEQRNQISESRPADFSPNVAERSLDRRKCGVVRPDELAQIRLQNEEPACDHAHQNRGPGNILLRVFRVFRQSGNAVKSQEREHRDRSSGHHSSQGKVSRRIKRFERKQSPAAHPVSERPDRRNQKPQNRACQNNIENRGGTRSDLNATQINAGDHHRSYDDPNTVRNCRHQFVRSYTHDDKTHSMGIRM